MEVSQLTQSSTGRIVYARPRGDWQRFKDHIDRERVAHTSIVVDMELKAGGVAPFRLDVSNIQLSDVDKDKRNTATFAVESPCCGCKFKGVIDFDNPKTSRIELITD